MPLEDREVHWQDDAEVLGTHVVNPLENRNGSSNIYDASASVISNTATGVSVLEHLSSSDVIETSEALLEIINSPDEEDDGGDENGDRPESGDGHPAAAGTSVDSVDDKSDSTIDVDAALDERTEASMGKNSPKKQNELRLKSSGNSQVPNQRQVTEPGAYPVPGFQPRNTPNVSRYNDDDAHVYCNSQEISALTFDLGSNVTGAATDTTESSRGVGSGIARASVVDEESLRREVRNSILDEAVEAKVHRRKPYRLVIGILVIAAIVATGGAIIGTQLRSTVDKTPEEEGPEIVQTSPSLAPSVAPSMFQDNEGLLAYLKSISLDGGAALEDMSTPQHSAYRWLAGSDSIDEWDNVMRVQSYALATFFYATGGGNWLSNSGWLSRNTTICSWYGVSSCEAGVVKEVELVDQNLVGSLPIELGLLTSLRELGLHKNRITGTMPSELGLMTGLREFVINGNDINGTFPSELQRLTRLRALNVQGTQLTGRIPSEFGRLTSLVNLFVSHTKLEAYIPTELGQLAILEEFRFYGRSEFDSNNASDVGTLPSELGLMTSLTKLSVYGNSFHGSIPSELGTLPLKKIFFQINGFSGELPSELGSISTLEQLRLDDNYLAGPIPTSFANLTSLTSLSLQLNTLTSFDDSLFGLSRMSRLLLWRNQLRGTIPTLVGLMTSLDTFDVSFNSLSSTLPTEICASPQLSMLAVEYNQMTGTIPREIYSKCQNVKFLGLGPNKFVGRAIHTEVGQMRTLDKLHLSSYLFQPNLLTGTFPTELGLLTQLSELTAAVTNMHGTIPTEFGMLSDLVFIRLKIGNFSGTIPSELGHLGRLQELVIGKNGFTGTIPKELGRMTSLQEVDLADTDLTGSMPTEICDLTPGLEVLLVDDNEVDCDCCTLQNKTQASDDDRPNAAPP